MLEPGEYIIQLSFLDERGDVIFSDDSCVITVPETTGPFLIPEEFDYDYEDVMVNLNRGSGYQELNELTEVGFIDYTSDKVNREQKPDIVLKYEDGDFCYDLAKGELIIASEVINKKDFILGKQYYVVIFGNTMSGKSIKIGENAEWIIKYSGEIEKEYRGNSSEPEYTGQETHIENKSEENFIQENVAEKKNIVEIISEGNSSDEPYAIDLTKGNTEILAAKMEEIIKINQFKDVEISTTDDVKFTFKKDSMKIIDGKDKYDFGVELIVDYAQAGVNITNENFVFRIKYKNTGELPGTAQVSIPLGSQWSGKEVCYSVIDERGILYTTMGIVSDIGIYTIPELRFTL